MAPEILKSEKYSGKSDIYTFGVLMWELLVPFYDKPRNSSLLQLILKNGIRPSIKTNVKSECYINLIIRSFITSIRQRIS